MTVYGAVILTKVIARVHPVHLMNVDTLCTFKLFMGGSVAEWLACWTQAQKGLGSNRSRSALR